MQMLRFNFQQDKIWDEQMSLLICNQIKYTIKISISWQREVEKI